MKISGSFLTMVLIWALGFTHIFGGPYFLFKVIFWIAILPYLISALVLLFVFFKAKKFLNTNHEGNSSVDPIDNNIHETIHVEATIKE